jgi:predicted DNA-binding transcriptional regulator AlpA
MRIQDMTPIHQQLIDSVLRTADRRTRELFTGLGYQIEGEARIEALRKSPLGQHLTNLANYAEGYSAASDIRGSAQFVSRFFFGKPFTFRSTSYQIPEKFHQSELGELVNAALLRFYQEERPGQLLTMEEMRQLFGVTRQAVHGWIRNGDIFPVWVKNTTRFYRKDVDRLIEKRTE